MRYGQPSIAAALASCQQKRIERLIVLPLFPQYCASTVGSVFECVTRQLSQLPWQPSVDFISGYATHHAYIEGLAQSVRDVWRARQQIATKSQTHALDRRHLILSFHGIPQVQADRGDLYAQQCQQTAMALADALGLASDEWTMAFQSRFGWQTWLQPYLDQVLQEKIDQGIEYLDIICPGFSVDCLETLEEIRDDYSRQFVEMGGKDCYYIPALNARPDHIKALAAVIESH